MGHSGKEPHFVGVLIHIRIFLCHLGHLPVYHSHSDLLSVIESYILTIKTGLTSHLQGLALYIQTLRFVIVNINLMYLFVVSNCKLFRYDTGCATSVTVQESRPHNFEFFLYLPLFTANACLNKLCWLYYWVWLKTSLLMETNLDSSLINLYPLGGVIRPYFLIYCPLLQGSSALNSDQRMEAFHSYSLLVSSICSAHTPTFGNVCI